MELLRHLASARRAPIRDLRHHSQALWPTDLPNEVKPDRETGPGGVFLSIGDRGRLPVEVIEAYRKSMNPERAFPVPEHS